MECIRLFTLENSPEAMSQNDPLTFRADEETHAAVEELGRDRGLSKSKAAEEALQSGLNRQGYRDADSTAARRLANSVAIGIFHVGATLILLSLFGSLSLLFAGVGALAASLCFALGSTVLIPKFEPSLSNRLPTIEVK